MAALRLTSVVLAVYVASALGSDPRYAKCGTCTCHYDSKSIQNFETEIANVTDASCRDWCSKARPGNCRWSGIFGCQLECGDSSYNNKFCGSKTTESECHGLVIGKGAAEQCPISPSGTRSKTCLDKVTCACNYNIYWENKVFDQLVDYAMCRKACSYTPRLNISTGCGSTPRCKSECARGCTDIGSCWFRRSNSGGCCEGSGECECSLVNAELGWKYNEYVV